MVRRSSKISQNEIACSDEAQSRGESSASKPAYLQSSIAFCHVPRILFKIPGRSGLVEATDMVAVHRLTSLMPAFEFRVEQAIDIGEAMSAELEIIACAIASKRISRLLVGRYCFRLAISA
jgi:hypothetical protein